ncbi:MAG TPA: hypothetical protein DEF42_15175 [Desulfosporosinus sp.]|nr:hypothetical protein [Desulfosporosinus sp.]
MGEDHLKQFNTRRKNALIILVGTIYLSFAGLILGQIQAIADFSYKLHELLFLPVNISIFLIPLKGINTIWILMEKR